MLPLSAIFLPYQIAWICDGASIAIAEKSRRIGWTYASAFRAVLRRAKLGTDLFYTATDLTAAREFVEQCMRWARSLGVMAQELGEKHLDEESGLSAFVIRFRGGGKIVAGSSNPKFFRSKGGDVDADEFAFHEQPRELYKAMQPTAITWGHRMRIWSSHNGEGSFFNQLIRTRRIAQTFEREDAECESHYLTTAADSARSAAGAPCNCGAGVPPAAARARGARSSPHRADRSQAPLTSCAAPRRRIHSLHRVTLEDAINQGLVEKVRNLDAPSPTARREFLEEIRATCPDPDAFAEEYLCQPASAGKSLLPYEAIASCEEEGLRLWDAEELTRPAGAANGPRAEALYAGFDVGRKRDRSVLWVFERVGDVFWTRCVHSMEGATFSAQEQLLQRVLAAGRVRRLCVDATGIGAMLAERLTQCFRHRVEAIHFTAGIKSDLAVPLVRLFQDRLVRVPADSDIREDLHKVRRVVTSAGHVRLDATHDAAGHADRFWAMALAHHAAERERARLPAPLLRKPDGWSG